MTDVVGQTIGNYRVEQKLGTGGMGEVYQAVHVHLDRLAAIKFLHAHLASDLGFQARFLREARIAAGLKHPNIVEIYDFGQQDDRFYLVMQLVTDGSIRTYLRDRARKGQDWSLRKGLDLVRQAADGLAYAHAAGMVHRDIKPDNLLLERLRGSTDESPEYRTLVADFGLARLAEGSTMTASGMMMGTPAYIAPEQWQGHEADARSDLYALGVVLFEVATGTVPFSTRTPSEAMYKHMHSEIPSPRDFKPDLSPELEAVILRCLAKRPEDRFQSMAELSDVLKRLIESPAGTVTPRPTPGYVAPPPVRTIDTLVGKQFGQYRLEERIAAGGSAWVYRGSQAGSQVPVIVKIVRPDVSHDNSLVLYFLREARPLTQMNHPNIARIHDVGVADGLCYLVTDYVEGRTLGNVLDLRRFELDEAVLCVRQIAAGLDYAHQRGIVHRALRPNNIMCRNDGMIVLTDFWVNTLNDLLGPPPGTSYQGEAAYLAPEQMQNRPVSPQTDIYALGCITYELLSGRPPFAGRSAQSMMTAHLEETPAPVHQRAPGLPPVISSVVARSLAKNPEDRYGTAAEFAGALSTVVALGDSTTDATVATPLPFQPGPPSWPPIPPPPAVTGARGGGGSNRWVLPVIAVAFLAALAGGIVFAFGGGGEDQDPTATAGVAAAATTTDVVDVAVTEAAGTATEGATTPEPGTTPELTMTVPPTPTYEATPEPTATYEPTPTPTYEPLPTETPVPTELIAFVSGRDGDPNIPDIFVVDTQGQGTRNLTSDPAFDAISSWAPNWSPDGNRIAFVSNRDGNDDIWIMDRDGSNWQKITNDPAAEQLPSWSPDGSRIAYQSLATGTWDIWVADVDGGSTTNITNSPTMDWGPTWSPDGSRIAFVSNRDGYDDIWVMNADGSDPVNLTSNEQTMGNPSWSPDGARIAFTQFLGNNAEIFVINADGTDLRQLTNEPSNDSNPTWSPDSSQIVFRADRDGNPEIYIMDADGSNPRRVTFNLAYDGAPSWSPVFR